jgi:hypothetical protein
VTDPEQSRCGYEHELSTPGARATGDVLLTLVTLNFTSWNRIVEWLGRLEAIRREAPEAA